MFFPQAADTAVPGWAHLDPARSCALIFLVLWHGPDRRACDDDVNHVQLVQPPAQLPWMVVAPIFFNVIGGIWYFDIH
jgi:hypothetical protein